jgi:hypothetical protein
VDQLTDLIKDYGGYAGLASVLGLAVLSLLYFAQAREVRRLREWAGRAPERAAEQEQRLATDVRRPSAVTARPIGAQTAAGQTATQATQATQVGQRPAGAPAATASPAAPAAAAASAAGNGQSGTPPAPAAGTAAPTPAPGVTAKRAEEKADEAKEGGGEAKEGGGETKPPAGGAGTDAASPAAPKPATPPVPAAPATPGVPAPRTAAARPAGAPPVRQPVRPAPARAAGAAPLRSGTPSRTLPPGTTVRGAAGNDGGGRRPIGKILAALAGVLVLAIVAVVLLTGGSGGSEQVKTQTNILVPPAGQDQATPQNPQEVTVGVLNGTSINGLARTTAEKLRSAGYEVPDDLIADAVERNRSATVVYFKEGSREAARQVAEAIGVGTDAVAPMDQDTLTLAGDRAPVVVTVGADQNTQSG